MSPNQDRWLDSLPTSRQEELLARHAAFWRREPGSDALIGSAPMSRVFPLRNLGIDLEGPLTPERVSDEVIAADTRYRPAVDPADDLLPAKIPLEPLAWAEGYVGANVFVSSKAQTVWAEPPQNPPQDPDDLDAHVRPAWRDKLVQVTRADVSAAGKDLLICEALLRGPADCLESLIGAQDLCLGLYDRPDVLAAMAERLTDRVLELYDAQLAALPPFHGGTVNRYRLWGPGRNIVTQADIANVMSPRHFRDIFVPAYRRLVGRFDTATIHFHTCAHQHVDALLEIDALDAIEWALDPTGPSLEDMVPVFRRILQTRCVILMNVRSGQQVKMLLDRLPHEGLCIIVRKEG